MNNVLKIMGVLMLISTVQHVNAGAVDFVATPPLISSEGVSDKPNVLVVLDNSGSMDMAANGEGLGFTKSKSKSFIARDVINTLVSNYTDRVRMGLMAYRQKTLYRYQYTTNYFDVSYDSGNFNSLYTGTDPAIKKYMAEDDHGQKFYYNEASAFYIYDDYPGFVQPPTVYCYSASGNYQATADVDTTHKCYDEKDNNTDFSYSDDDWDEDVEWESGTYYKSISVYDPGKQYVVTKTARVWGGSGEPDGLLHVAVAPLDSGQATLITTALGEPSLTNSTDSPLRNGGGTPIEGTLMSARKYYAGTLGADNAVGSVSRTAPTENICTGKDFVILITDGLPSVNADGTSVTSVSDALTKAATVAGNLLADGVKTFVVGFALPSGVSGNVLDAVAVAGGTGSAYLASDKDSLVNTMNSIFLSIVNRTSSSTGAAVIANNSKGTGALYQAVYKPNIEDGYGNKVQWVGNLKGIFFDSKGSFREDTNQNAQLDDTDKVATYFYDDIGKRTRIHLGDYDALGNVTTTSTIEPDELKAVWSARDNLALLTDLSTQRDYASLANTGRHIVTSLDGTNTINFRALSSSQYQALVDAQVLATQQYNLAKGEDDSAQSNLDDRTTELNDANTALTDAQQELTDATSTQAGAQSTYDGSYAAYEPERDALATDWTQQQSNLTTVRSLNDARVTQVENYQTAQKNLLTAKHDLALDLANKLGFSSLESLTGDALLAYQETQSATTAKNQAASDYGTTSNNLTGSIDDMQNSGFATLLANDQFGSIVAEKNEYANDINEAASDSGSRNTDYSELNTAWNKVQADYDALISYLYNKGGQPVSVAVKKAGIDDLETTKNNALLDVGTAEGDFNGGVTDFQTARNTADLTYSGLFSTRLATVNTDANNLATANTRLADAQTDLTSKTTAQTNAQTAYDNAVASKGDTATILVAATASKSAADEALAQADTDALIANYMGQPTAAKGLDVIRFIRGEEVTDMRNRKVDYDNDNDVENLLLGDIVHSSPAVVAAPQDRYDSIYNDTTYAEYRNQYSDRRQMIYVGANDGMLHAFNGGFWDNSINGFVKQMNGEVEHELGDELWAYVPKSALPHLQWLTDPGYAHTYYVDGAPTVHDVNIFPSDSVHTNGWGTILVVGMRFGGGEIEVNTNYGVDPATDYTSYSSIMIFDITDPESAPELMAEISHPNMGFTTSIPTISKARVAGASGYSAPLRNDWILTWGSGPTVLDTANSTQQAGVFALDLKSMSFITGWSPKSIPSTQLSGNAFLGDFNSVDLNNDFVDDAIYFGSSKDSVTDHGSYKSVASSGELFRLVTDDTQDSNYAPIANWFKNSTINKLVDSSTMGPFVSAPQVAKDNKGRQWIYAGGGRLLVNEDNSNSEKRQFFAIKEPVDSNGVFTWDDIEQSKLVNNSSVTVDKNGDLGSNKTIGSSSVGTFSELEAAMDKTSNDIAGWVYDFENTNDPSGRNLNTSVLLRKALYFTQYVPSGNQCAPEGMSYLHALYYKTGTWSHRFVDDNGVDSDGNPVQTNITSKTDMGQGLMASPKVVSGENGDTLMGQKSTSELFTEQALKYLVPSGRESWREIEL